MSNQLKETIKDTKSTIGGLLSATAKLASLTMKGVSGGVSVVNDLMSAETIQAVKDIKANAQAEWRVDSDNTLDFDTEFSKIKATEAGWTAANSISATVKLVVRTTHSLMDE